MRYQKVGTYLWNMQALFSLSEKFDLAGAVEIHAVFFFALEIDF